MQNTVYECKQNGEDFFSSLTVTCFCFGNRPANGLVTEQPQYSVVVCIFHILQNTEIQLISNDLRLIFTCSLLLASPCIFHGLRQTGSTLLAKVGSLRIIGPAIGAAMLLLLGFPAGTFLGLGTFEGGFPPPACWLRVNLALPLSPDSSRRHPSHILAVRDGHRSFPPFPRTLSSRSGH